VISGRGVDVEATEAQGILVGTIKSTPEARFAARQITFDKLSTPKAVRDAIKQDIVGLIEQVGPTWRHD